MLWTYGICREGSLSCRTWCGMVISTKRPPSRIVRQVKDTKDLSQLKSPQDSCWERNIRPTKVWWLITPRVLLFMSLCHNMAIWIFCKFCYIIIAQWSRALDMWFVLFVFFGVFRPTREFFTHSRCHHCRWRAANFDLCSTLMAIEQCGVFSVPHLLWRGASVYNGHLWGPVTLTLITHTYYRAFGSGAVTTCFYDFFSVAAGIRTLNLPLARRPL